MDEALKERLKASDPALRAVTLSYGFAGDDEIEELCSLLPNCPQVTVLFLDGNVFGAEGMASLAKSLAGSAIEELWLSDNENIDDDCAPHIATVVAGCPSLRSLLIAQCGLSSKGVRKIVSAIAGSGRKVNLDVSGNDGVADEEAEKFHEIASSTRQLPTKEAAGGADPGIDRTESSMEEILRAKVQKLELQLREKEREGEDIARAASEVRPLYRTLRASDIELGDKIGSGGFSKIYRGTWLGKEVAVKKLRGAMDDAAANAFYKEMNLLSGLRHPNVLLLLGACEMDGKMVIITELMLGGSLYGLLQRYKKKGLSLEPRVIRSVLLDVALGMCYLHECDPPVIHRDLKSMNILLDEHGTAKVADFGLSRERQDNATMTAGLGTPHWLAPEIARREKYDEKVDVYSFGIMMWEMVALEVPFADLDAFTLIGRLLSDDDFRPEIPPNTDESVARLMKRCWAHKASDRPSFKEIVKIIKEEFPTD